MDERMAFGLDVDARSIKACALDTVTGELVRRCFPNDPAQVVGWAGGLPGPVMAAYEAGPTGYGLARALDAAGLGVVVAA